MYRINKQQDAWENFAQTGKIQDYLQYKLTDTQEFTAIKKGAIPDAADHRRDRPEGLQNRRG